MTNDLTQKFLNKIPKQYRENIVILSPEKGGNSRVEYLHPICGCKTTSTLKTFVKRKSFDSCLKCSNQKNFNYYKSKIAFPNNIDLLEPFHGGATKVSFKHNICECIINTTLSRLTNRDQLDYCKKCYQAYYYDSASNLDNVKIIGKNKGYNSDAEYTCSKCSKIFYTKLSNLINRKDISKCHECSKQETLDSYLTLLSKDILNRIKVLNHNGSYSRIKYDNPCGHQTESTISDFVKREQFDYCQHCSQKKSVTDYIDLIDKKYHQNIEIVKDLGAKSPIIYTCPSCGNKRRLTVKSLQRFDDCLNCNNSCRISKQEMIDNLKPFLNNIKIVDGFPGHRTSVVTGNCVACNSKVENYYFNFSRYYTYYNEPRCSSCSPKSIEQKMLANFVGSLTDFIENDKSIIKSSETDRNLEIDIYCPKEKFAIEYNGLLWHSEKYGKDKNYHFYKTRQCQEHGIYLLHIWSDKYKKHPEIYHSIIRYCLGKIKNRIFARRCILKELDKNISRDFFTTNHLDGNVGCLKAWGLFHDEKLIQAISVRRVSKQNSKYASYLEIARMATLLNHSVVGGESKLLSFVEKFARDNEYAGILNYVSADFGKPQQNKYHFEYKGITDVSYCYTDGNKRISRQRLQNRPKGVSERAHANSLNLWRVNLTPNFIYILNF